MKACIIGATGATGRELVSQLLADTSFDSITCLVRRNTLTKHPKLKEIVIDFDKPSEWEKYLADIDVAFSCLGTTIKDAGSKDNQYRIDYTYQFAFAQAANKYHVPRYVYISSANADARARLFYPRIKGELDNSIASLPIKQIIVVKPNLLDRKDTDRIGEKIALWMLNIMNKVGLFHKYRPIKTTQVAHAMISLSKESYLPHHPFIVKGNELYAY